MEFLQSWILDKNLRFSGEMHLRSFFSCLWYIALEDIYYFAAEGNYTQLHGKHHTALLGDKLKQWQQKTEDMPFVRIHKSYLINMLHVKKWEAGKVTLENGTTVPIGRQYTKEAREIYNSFVRKQAMKRM